MDSQTNSQNSPLTQIPPEVIKFLDNLLAEANIVPIDETMREQLLLELYSRLDNFITTTIMENMPPEKLDEFIKLNEEKRPREEIDQYMRENMPNSQEVFAKAFVDFRDIYLGNAGVTENQTQIPPTN